MPDRVVVIGGNAAGMTAASRAKRLAPDLDVTILEASDFISYSICGVPYYLSGQVARHQELIRYTPETLLEERGIRARTGVVAEEVLAGRRRVACREVSAGREFEVEYDKLVIATGYRPRLPSIEGCGLANVFTVSRLEDGLLIGEAIGQSGARSAAIVGAGYIGLMMAHALRQRGLEVLLFDRNSHVFSQLDDEMAELVQGELRRQGVQLHLESEVRALEGEGGAFRAVRVGREQFPADLALVDVGVRPGTGLAEASGIPLGLSGAIDVDDRGQTQLPGIYAAGNCAETRHLVSGKPVFSALGTTAAKQGRAVGENLAGRRSTFSGTLETSIEKVFDLSIARTGLTLRQALRDGFEARAVQISSRDRAVYYPGSAPMHVRLVFEKRNGRLLGGQIVGSDAAAKRIDTLVTALTAGMDLRQLSQLDLAYAPPSGTLWDPILIAANVALRAD